MYHTNDLHSHFEQWPKIASYLNKRKRYHQKRKEDVFFFDIGDHMDRVNQMTEATMGKGNIQIMNGLGYQNVTIGNNEGITLTKESLCALYEEANFNVVLANLLNENGNRPKWASPYEIHTLENGLKVGVTGMTAPFSLFYKELGWEVLNPFDILPSLVEEIRKEADIVILLSHLGINDDEKIAEEIPGIDVIMGGHTHHLFKTGKVIKGTLLAAAGKFGKYVGEVCLSYDHSEQLLVNKEASVVEMDTQKECISVKQQISSINKRGEEILAETLCHLNKEYAAKWFEPSPLADLLVTGLKEWCDAEIGMLNAGVLLDGLEKGPITKADLHRICPHPINPCKVELKGDELKEVILMSFTEKMQNLELKGFGFRGKVMGRMVFDGVEVRLKRLDDGLEHVTEIFILGERLDPTRTYSVATLDMFTFGYLYPELTHAKKKKYYLPELLRDVLTHKLITT